MTPAYNRLVVSTIVAGGSCYFSFTNSPILMNIIIAIPNVFLIPYLPVYVLHIARLADI